MGFVSTEGNGAIRFDEIVRHWVSGDQVHFTTKRGETFRTTQHKWDLAYYRETQHLIPAAAGTFYLEWAEQEDGSYRWDKSVVLAWGLGIEGYLVPIGTDGIDERSRPVLHPSGLVTKGLEGEWMSFEDFARWDREYGVSKR